MLYSYTYNVYYCLFVFSEIIKKKNLKLKETCMKYYYYWVNFLSEKLFSFLLNDKAE